MVARLKLGAIAALVLALVALGYAYRGEVRAAAQAALGIEQLRQAIAEQEQRMAQERTAQRRLEELALEYAREIRAIRAQQSAMAREVRELEQKDTEVRAWGETRIPSALLDLDRGVRDGEPAGGDAD